MPTNDTNAAAKECDCWAQMQTELARNGCRLDPGCEALLLKDEPKSYSLRYARGLPVVSNEGKRSRRCSIVRLIHCPFCGQKYP